MKNGRKGFTLVELIVVLVILAVLAAITIPALMGYIDKARESQDRFDAENYLTAIQTSLTELYAMQGGTVAAGESVIPKGKVYSKNGNADVDASGTVFAQNVFKLAEVEDGEKPLFLMVGLGSNAINTNSKTTLHDKYTVLFLFYLKDEASKPLLFFNGEWTNSYMKKTKEDTRFMDVNNVIKGGALNGKRLQYYCLSYAGTHGTFGGTDFWNWVRSKQE